MHKKETTQLVRRLERMEGVTVTQRRSGKWMVTGPEPGSVSIHQTNSERRGYHNLVGRLRKIGIEI